MGETADAAHMPKMPAKPERVIDARLKPKQEILFDDLPVAPAQRLYRAESGRLLWTRNFPT